MSCLTIRNTSNRIAVESPNNNTPFIAVIGPIVLYALWPWLWHDTFERLREHRHLRQQLNVQRRCFVRQPKTLFVQLAQFDRVLVLREQIDQAMQHVG